MTAVTARFADAAYRYAGLGENDRMAFRKAARARGIDPSVLKIVPLADRTGHLPLSHAQERLWFLWCLEPESSAYNIAGATRLHGCLDQDALRIALTGVVSRHEALRTRFEDVGGVPTQVVGDEPVYTWNDHDLSAIMGAEREIKLDALLRENELAPFDLEQGPLLRAGLVKLEHTEYVLMLAMHHIVSDAWSMDILLREFGELYAAAAERRAAHLPALEIQYRDYARWQREWLDDDALEGQLTYWRNRLGNEHPTLALPTARMRKGARSGAGGRVERVVSVPVTERLKTLSRELNATLFMTLLAAWQLLLHRYSGQSEIRVGVPVAGRQRIETEALVGFFVNTLVLRADLHGSMSVADLIGQARERMIEAQANQDVAFSRLVDLLQPERSLTTTPLFQTMFSYEQVDNARVLALPDLVIQGLGGQGNEEQFDLVLDAVESDCGISLSIGYASDILDEDIIEQLADHFADMLEALCPSMAVGEVTLSANAPARDVTTYPIKPITERIAEKSAECFDAEAIFSEAERVSYGALQEQSNRIARRLLTLGAEPDMRIGVCVGRSAGMAASLLGVLNSGAAYVPLDPEYPEDRLAVVISDSRIGLIVADRASAERHADLFNGLSIVLIDGEDLAGEGAAPLAVEIHPHQLAYVIYTSGSTGTPKGVAISHGSLSLHVDDYLARYDIDSRDVILQFSTINFDSSVEQLFPTLVAGARVVLRGPELWDGQALNNVLGAESVTFADLPTGYWRQWLSDLPPAGLPSLRVVAASGEALAGEAVARWRNGPLGNVRLDNSYGPTEATVTALSHETTDADTLDAIVPIGTAWAGRAVHILDADGNVVPLGGFGELCIGGDSLARGYLHRPGLTAERFVPDPWGRGSRLYLSLIHI